MKHDMTQDMKRDMILHTITRQLVRNWRTRVLSAAHSSSFTSALTQGRKLCADEITSRPSRDYGSLLTRLRLVVLMLLMMFVGVDDVWGQTDYSGTYYIRSGSVKKQTSGEYYLCPTEGWAYFYATDDLRDVDNGQPFLTTHHMENGDKAKYVWIIEKHTIEGHDYYAFQYNIDYVDESSGSSYSRYLSYNRKLAGKNVYADRMRVHLKKTDSQNLTDYELFDITEATQTVSGNSITYLAISPKKKDEDDGNKQKYLVVNGGNTDAFISYYPDPATGGVLKKDNGPSPYTLTTGIIGTYNLINDDNAPFYLEKAPCSTPIISFDSSTSKVTITSKTEGATIYYTTDGVTTPDPEDTEEAKPTKVYNSTNKPTILATTTVKAIAIKSGYANSEVATKSIEKLDNPSVAFDDATQKVTITKNSVVEGAKSVFTTDGNDPIPSSTEYSEAISLTGTTTVKAMNVKNGYINSDVVPLIVTKLASSPTITMGEGRTVTLEYTEDGAATIYYTTDGSTPIQGSSESSVYSAPFSLGENPKYTIKAIATKAGFLNSDVSEEVVDNRSTIPVPTITYTYNTVTITASDYGDEIYYTIDGNDPTTSTTTHFTTSGSFDLVWGNSYTIKAIASNGVTSSSVATATIDLTDIGYAGIYYIRNNEKPGNYYMYPVGSGSALVTTAQKTDEEAIWKIEKVGGGYYRIIHYKDGKYLVAKDLVNEVMPDEETVSLVQTDNPGENALFEITRNSGTESDILQHIILIRPKAATDATTTTTTTGDHKKYLNKRGGNTTSNPIGLWNASGSSLWQLATVPAKPTITVNDINVTISSDLNHVYYTTDGMTNPTKDDNLKYNGEFTLKYGPSYTIKAICIYHDNISGTDWSSEIATSDPIQVPLQNPVFTRSGNSVTITNNQSSSIKVRYTFSNNGTFPADPVPDGAGYDYTSALPLTANARNVFKAIAYNTVDGTTYTSGVVTFDVDLRSVTTISSLADITSASGYYKLGTGFSATGTPKEGDDEIGTSTNPFKGIIDGNLVEFELGSSPLFDYVQDATIKNVIISKATISTSGNAGAICNEADGATKIYNCGINSGSVSGSGNVGGLVGLIKSGSKVRVVNCYNYADVSSTGEYAAGIVGKNEGTIASNKTVGDVRIALCMMYGSVSGATHRSPVYGGNHVSNAQNFTEYNYYLYSNERDTNGKIIKKINYTSGDYNDQLAIEKDDYLTRFPFYRHILNTHREVAAFFLFGAPTTNSVKDITTAQVEEIGHWVVKKGTDAPKYPVVEAWGKNTKTTPYYNSSTDNNYTPPSTTDDYAGKLLTDMGDGTYKGYLKVTVKMSSDHTLYLPITDMDTLRYDYNYGKVILPFANEYEVNTDYTRICTGWKITNVDGITSSSVSNYNFADRDNKQKDIYDSNNPYIFAQGGYYIVPKGVKAIEITPNYATAYYLSDASYDVGLDTSYGGETPLGGTVPNGANAFHGQTVYTSLSSALGAMSTTNNPHQQAIVLVGNYHFDGASLTDSKAFTFMSIDEDCNQEPDYGFYMYNKQDRPTAPAMRFDFLPVIPVGWAAHVAGSGGFKGVPIWKVRGWFEITETCVFYTDQCEIDSENFKETNNGKGNNPWVINSGYFVQIVRTNKNSTGCNRVSYIKMGGNVYVKEFYPGAHSEVSGKITKIVPVNVTGGEIKECFMTGYNSKCSAEGENIQFWCAGGKIHKFLGAYMDKPTSATVNVTANIDHALITRFYGGGTSAEASITGDIEVTITNSKVDFYCGGPEFSSLTAKPTVTTIASNTIFGQYYGAGFGGTSITYNLSKQESGYAIGSDKVTFPISFSSYYKRLQNLTVGGKSLGTCYKLEYIHHSRQQQLVARFFTGYAEFSLATTGNVSNTLDGCTIKSDFYGAGCQGKVDGMVSSTLTNCKVDGSVYGGGYKATANEVKVYTTTQPEYSIYDKETAIFSEFGTVAPETYTWGSGTAGTVDQGSKVLYTDAPMGQLGVVTNDITLTIKGKKSDATYTVKNNVFGGGNESPSEKKATVVIEDYVDGNNNASGTIVQGSVYGGGNEAPIGTDSKVTLKGSTNVQGNVFGGGNMGVVNGSATVEIKAN